jgi:hypothetical protein
MNLSKFGCDNYIIGKIRYEYIEDPKLNYDNLVRYLEKVFKGSCSSSCQFRHMFVYHGKLYYTIPIVRQTDEKCAFCNHSISCYSHLFCVHCAPENSIEYLYHHSRCHPDIQRRYDILFPQIHATIYNFNF